MAEPRKGSEVSQTRSKLSFFSSHKNYNPKKCDITDMDLDDRVDFLTMGATRVNVLQIFRQITTDYTLAEIADVESALSKAGFTQAVEDPNIWIK